MKINDANENAIIEKKEDIVPQDKTAVVQNCGKVLHITPKTEGVDYNGLLARLVQYVNIADALSHVEKTVEYVVQIPAKHMKAFETGKAVLNQNSKTGVLWPTLYQTLESGKRQFVGNLPVKQKEFLQGNPFESIANSYQNLYMQQQIGELAEKICMLCKSVERIEQGQMDDRIGLLIAGRNQIALAFSSSPENRAFAIENGRSNLLAAQNQFLETFKSRVKNYEEIPKSRWKRFRLELKHSGYHKGKDKEFEVIQEYYALFLHATRLVAASYLICGDTEAAEKVFDMAEQEIKNLNFDSVKTLDYIHKNNPQLFYYHADEYVYAEKQQCMEEAKEYETISVEVSGAKLLEVLSNERPESVSNAKSGQ